MMAHFLMVSGNLIVVRKKVNSFELNQVIAFGNCKTEFAYVDDGTFFDGFWIKYPRIRMHYNDCQLQAVKYIQDYLKAEGYLRNYKGLLAISYIPFCFLMFILEIIIIVGVYCNSVFTLVFIEGRK